MKHGENDQLSEYQPDWIKIVDFSLMANFWAKKHFCLPVFTRSGHTEYMPPNWVTELLITSGSGT